MRDIEFIKIKDRTWKAHIKSMGYDFIKGTNSFYLYPWERQRIEELLAKDGFLGQSMNGADVTVLFETDADEAFFMMWASNGIVI